jgi:hypothetical protein
VLTWVSLFVVVVLLLGKISNPPGPNGVTVNILVYTMNFPSHTTPKIVLSTLCANPEEA